MSDLPTSALLGPFEYQITADLDEWETSGADPGDLYGHCDHQRGVILVHPSTSEAMKRVVLLHELMHAAVFCAGQIDTRKRREEEWVVMTAPMLLDALRRSPKLAAYLLDAV